MAVGLRCPAYGMGRDRSPVGRLPRKGRGVPVALLLRRNGLGCFYEMIKLQDRA